MLATLGFLLLTQRAGVQDPRRAYAAGDKEAVLMLPPVAVCDGDVREMAWTADGSGLVVRRTVSTITASETAALATGRLAVPPAPPRVELVVWSLRSHKARVVLSGDASALSIERIEAMPGSDRVVFFSEETAAGPDGAPKRLGSISVISTNTGAVTRLARTDEGALVDFSLSPTRPLGYLTLFDAATKARSVRFFGPDGRAGGAIALPPRSQMDFDNAGLPFLFLGAERKVKGKPSVFHLQKVNVAAGTLGATYDASDIAGYDRSGLDDEYRAMPVSGNADGTKAPSILLRLPGAKTGETGVVTTDGVNGLVSPKRDAVAYVSQGSAVVRPLARVSRQAYETAMVEARKAIAMNNAKQVGLGLMMFAADMDDVLPTPDKYSMVDPYLKDSAMMSSFTYTFGGGDMKGVERPAETEMGYVSGPGGRAVAYVDGHVRWVPNAP